MKSIKELRENLERAQAEYLAADIEHPTKSTLAKDDLDNARHEYQHACVEAVEKLLSFNRNMAGDYDEVVNFVYMEVWE